MTLYGGPIVRWNNVLIDKKFGAKLRGAAFRRALGAESQSLRVDIHFWISDPAMTGR